MKVRQHVLWATPQEEGGCRGCRFFLQCGGQCPGTAIGGDWRRRSADCFTWFSLLERVEGQMLARGERPASLEPDLEARIQARLDRYVSPVSVHQDEHGDATHADEHGDHTDHADTHTDTHEDTHTDNAHQDAAHGDAAHSDSHSDHSDHGDVAHADAPEVV